MATARRMSLFFGNFFDRPPTIESAYADNATMNNYRYWNSSSPADETRYNGGSLYQASPQRDRLVTGEAMEPDAYNVDGVHAFGAELDLLNGFAGLLPDKMDERQQVASAVDQLLLMKNGKSYVDKVILPDGYIMERVHVPYSLVGLVVGLKGANIKRIQKEAQTVIVTPAKNKLPIFMLIGQPENVQRARKLIELHIERRTNNKPSVVTLPSFNGAAEQPAAACCTTLIRQGDSPAEGGNHNAWGPVDGSRVDQSDLFNGSADHLVWGSSAYFAGQWLNGTDSLCYEENYDQSSPIDMDEGLGFDVVAWLLSELLNDDDVVVSSASEGEQLGDGRLARGGHQREFA